MRIQLLAFGIAKDLIGKSSLFFELRESGTVKELKDKLIIDFPGLNNIYEFAIAVNEEYANDDLVINENDVIAIIPPVSGG